MKLFLNSLEGKLTKSGIGLVAVVDLIQQAAALINGQEVQSVIAAGEGVAQQISIFIGELTIAWGAFRALINYGKL